MRRARAGTRPCAGWAGRPEYGNSLLVKAPLTATDADRLDLGLSRVRAPGPRGRCRAARRSLFAVTHLHHLPDAARGAAAPGGGAARLAGRVAAPRRDDRGRRLQRGSAGARAMRGCARPGSASAYAAANGAEPAVTWPSGLQAPGDGHRRRPGLPRLHLAPRRRRASRMRGSCSTGRRSAIRRSTRRTTSASPRACGAGRARCAPGAPPRPSRRLAAGAGEHARGAGGGAGRPRLRRRRVRRPPAAATASRCCSTTRRWRASSVVRGAWTS